MSMLPDPSFLTRLDAGLAYRLTLLIEPAGERVGAPAEADRLLHSWMAHAQWPVYHMVLDPHHDDPAFFFHEVAAKLLPVTGPVEIDGLTPEVCVVEIINAITLSVDHRSTESASDFALVLDGYDTISSPAIHEAVVLMLDYLPPQMHVVIVSAGVPPLVNIPRLRARRQLLQLSL